MQNSVSLDAHAVLLPQFAGLHDFTACLLQLRVLVELLRKAGQRLLGTLKMFAQVIVASSVFIPIHIHSRQQRPGQEIRFQPL